MKYTNSLLFISIAAFVAAVACGAVQSLTPGQTLINRKCGACHPSPKNKKLTEEQAWKIMERHRKRVPLTDDERRVVVETLSDMIPAETGSD